MADSCAAVYGRYQIMDDRTEVLDKCVAEVFRFSLEVDADTQLESDLLTNSKDAQDDKLDLSTVEKELHILSPYLVSGGTSEGKLVTYEFCYGVYNLFIYLNLMVKNMEVSIERYFKWWTSIKLVWTRYQNY
jgi:hypothetical protein